MKEPNHEIFSCKGGGWTLRDLRNGQTMHSEIGPWREAWEIFVRPSRIEERISRTGGALIIADVGLGMAANALCALASWRAVPGPKRPLKLVSYETDPSGLERALAGGPGFLDAFLVETRALLRHGRWESDDVVWELRTGDFTRSPLCGPELVFFDLYSPKTQPDLWTRPVFEHLRAEMARTVSFSPTVPRATSEGGFRMRVSMWDEGRAPRSSVSRLTRRSASKNWPNPSESAIISVMKACMRLLPFILAILPLVEAVAEEDAKHEQIQGVCALVLKLGEWTDKITLPAYEVAEEPTLDLSAKKTFLRVQSQPDGTEVKREGQAPPQLKPYNIRLSYEQDDKTGWPGHEEVVVSFTLFERKNKSRLEGPFKATVIRRIVEPRETTEDMPFVSGYARISTGEKLEFRFGCSKALGT